VFSNPKWQRFALLLNLIGTALLFFSFQATSSDFKLVTAKSHSVLGGDSTLYALCVNDYALLVTSSHNDLGFGHPGCPAWDMARPAAVVNIEHPMFEGLGFLILLCGFFLQYLSVPQPKTIADVRAELKTLKEHERAKRPST
jgi:hypothetical protein